MRKFENALVFLLCIPLGVVFLLVITMFPFLIEDDEN